METIRTRNVTLDYFKLALMMLVVLAHMDYDGVPILKWGMKYGISYIAVPCFFIINGYFFANVINDKQKVKRYVSKLLTSYVVWMLVYFGFYSENTIFLENNYAEFVLTILRGFYHLWYIPALIVASIILWLARNLNYKLILAIALFIGFIGFLVGKSVYFEHLDVLAFQYLDTDYLPYFTNSFLFRAFPYLTIGYFIRKMDIPSKGFNNNSLLFAVIALFCMYIVELYIIRLLMVEKEIYIFTSAYLTLFLLCPALFIYILRTAKYKQTDDQISKLTSGIYFIHPFILLTLGSEFSHFSHFFLIVLISLFFAYCLTKVSKTIKILR